MQLLRDIYRIAGADYGENGNVYAVNCGNEIVLIDSGYDEIQRETAREALEYWGLSDIPVTGVLFTHSHLDHTGNAGFYEKKGATLYASKADADAIMKFDDRCIEFGFRMGSHTMGGKKHEPVSYVEPLHDGQKLTFGNMTFECIAVPGHTDGSMMFLTRKDEKKVVFSGDHAMISTNAEDAILCCNIGPDNERKKYLASVTKTKDLEVDVVLPGHYQPLLHFGTDVFKMLYKEALINLR